MGVDGRCCCCCDLKAGVIAASSLMTIWGLASTVLAFVYPHLPHCNELFAFVPLNTDLLHQVQSRKFNINKDAADPDSNFIYADVYSVWIYLTIAVLCVVSSILAIVGASKLHIFHYLHDCQHERLKKDEKDVWAFILPHCITTAIYILLSMAGALIIAIDLAAHAAIEELSEPILHRAVAAAAFIIIAIFSIWALVGASTLTHKLRKEASMVY